MMNTIKKCFVFALFVALQSCAQEKETQKVDFLVGTWQIEGKQTYESWKKTGKGLTGESYKMREGVKQISENLTIKIVEGKIIYTATVLNQNGGKGIPFELAPIKDALYSFENPTHDFPNKIQYKLLSKTELQVNVLGKDGKGFSYKMIKQS